MKRRIKPRSIQNDSETSVPVPFGKAMAEIIEMMDFELKHKKKTTTGIRQFTDEKGTFKEMDEAKKQKKQIVKE